MSESIRRVTCLECDAPLPPRRRRFCCDRCKQRGKDRRRSEKRHLRYLAQGFGRRTCEVCGAEYIATWNEQRACGCSCGFFLKRMDAGLPLYSKRLHGQHSHIAITPCAMCGDLFVTHAKNGARRYCAACERTAHLGGTWVRGRKVCSDCGAPIPVYKGSGNYCAECARQRLRDWVRARGGNSHAHRARFFGVPYESVDRVRVFERDHWRCHICGRKVLRPGSFPHPRSPSVDCLVPLSVPGSPGYVYTNVACACLLCNSIKSNGCTEEQLLLVG